MLFPFNVDFLDLSISIYLFNWLVLDCKVFITFFKSIIYLFFSSNIFFHCCYVLSCEGTLASGDWYRCLSCWIYLYILAILVSYIIFKLPASCWFNISLILFFKYSIYLAISFVLISLAGFTASFLPWCNLLITSAFSSFACCYNIWLILLFNNVFYCDIVIIMFFQLSSFPFNSSLRYSEFLSLILIAFI